MNEPVAKTYLFDILPISSVAIPLITKVLVDNAFGRFATDAQAYAFGYSLFKELISDMFSCFDCNSIKWAGKIKQSFIYPDSLGFAEKTGTPYVQLAPPDTDQGRNMSVLLTDIELNIAAAIWRLTSPIVDFRHCVRVDATLPDSSLINLRIHHG